MQKNPLISKVALVTGAARRIGAEIAQLLHQEGMNVVLHYNASGEEAHKLCQTLNAQRANSAIALPAELQDMENIKMLVQKAGEAWGRLDVLVNNASKFYKTNFGEITDFEWNDLLGSNIKAPFFLAQAAAPLLKVQEGCIVNITDLHGERPLSEYSVYSISKGALLAMNKVLAKELGPKIRVNAVSPGAVIWPEGENSLSEGDKQKIIKRTVLQRSGDASDIAKSVLFFVRDAGYVTGQVLTVDGGRIIG